MRLMGKTVLKKGPEKMGIDAIVAQTSLYHLSGFPAFNFFCIIHLERKKPLSSCTSLEHTGLKEMCLLFSHGNGYYLASILNSKRIGSNSFLLQPSQIAGFPVRMHLAQCVLPVLASIHYEIVSSISPEGLYSSLGTEPTQVSVFH